MSPEKVSEQKRLQLLDFLKGFNTIIEELQDACHDVFRVGAVLRDQLALLQDKIEHEERFRDLFLGELCVDLPHSLSNWVVCIVLCR